jgi:two-component system, NarL family, response regulator DegU
MSLILEDMRDIQVISQASDGVEAVDLARELHPDLIFMDIGLPKLDGIEAARRIHTFSPDSKIIFATQETSADFVEEALSTGALGYVVKEDACGELLSAIDVVLHGGKYVSRRLRDHEDI